MARFRLVATAKLSLWRVSNPVGVVKIPRAEKEQNRVGELGSNPVGVVKIPRAEKEQNRVGEVGSNPVGVVKISRAEKEQNRVGEVGSNPVGVVKISRAENEQNRARREIFEAERDQNVLAGRKRKKNQNRRIAETRRKQTRRHDFVFKFL